MRALLAAVVAIGSGLDLHATLQRIASAATTVTGARYAAVGVIRPDGAGLSDFVHEGVDAGTAARIGPLPRGRGLLGALITDPRPLRLDDLGADPRSYGFPPHHPPMHSFLGVPIRVRDEVFGNLYLTEKPGGFDAGDERVVLALAAAAGAAIENSRLYEAARRRERWVVGTQVVGTALLASESAEETREALTLVADQLRELAEGELGLILEPTAPSGRDGSPPGASGTPGPAPEAGEGMEGTETLRVVYASTAAEAPAAPRTAAGGTVEDLHGTLLEPCPATLRLLRGEPVFTDDARAAGLLPRPPSPEPAPGAPAAGPAMALPLTSTGRLLGALTVVRPPGAPAFGADERRLATSFAAQAALALRIAEGQADQQRLAVYQDRDRIARDLHDLVIQRLFATGMVLEGAERRIEAEEVRERIGKAVDELDATIKEVRGTIYALQHDEAEDDAEVGLRTRVLRETGQSAAVLGFRPAVTFVGPVDTAVGAATARQLVVALREMLSNAARHARAHRVTVEVDASVLLDADGLPTFASDTADAAAAAVGEAGAAGSAGDAGEADAADAALAEALVRASAARPGVLVSVTDDGVGIPAGGRRSGLRNLADRAHGRGGHAWHEPGPGGRGTTVHWTALR